MPIRLTAEKIEAGKSAKGGFTKARPRISSYEPQNWRNTTNMSER